MQEIKTQCALSPAFFTSQFTDVYLNLLNFQNVCIAGASVYCTSGKDKVVYNDKFCL